MEPRIATLLGESAEPGDPAVLDPFSLLPTPSGSSRRDRERVRDDGLTSGRHRDNAASAPIWTRPSPHRLKSSVPIAEVLNDNDDGDDDDNDDDDDDVPPQPASIIAAPDPPTQPFSGRLQDILLDPSQQVPSKRRKVDGSGSGGGGGQASPSALPAAENALLTLPKPPRLPKKTLRRPRIPPLLQGLHQPPPLPPQAQLFPPITSEGGAFARNMAEMTPLRSPIARDTSKEKETHVARDKENSKTADGKEVSGASAEKPRKGGRLTPISGNDKEKRTQTTTKVAENGTVKRKERKKRNKWSDEETKHLLHGVSKYGIGNWKKILNDAEYSFNQRTAVDLKDRFRTCCPSESSTPKGDLSTTNEKSSSFSKDAKSSNPADKDGASIGSTNSAGSTPASARPPRKVRSDVHKKSSNELAKMGIVSPFQPSKRRQRREFTDLDDENLWKGYEKYGPIWHSMRDDKKLGFEFRHPTDLRDRFRIRYPEEYAKAGYKLKPKDKQMLKEKQKEREKMKVTEKDEPASQESSAPASGSQHSNAIEKTDNLPPSQAQVTAAASSAPASSNLRAHTLLQPLRSSYPTPLQDFSDLVSEDDGDGDQSPITLNRNIFQWADAHPSQSNNITGLASINTMPPISSLAGGDAGFNLFAGIDDMHIDPRALRLHLAPMQNGNSLSALPAFLNPNQIGQISSITSNMLQTGPSGAFSSPSTQVPSANTSTSAPKQSSNDDLLRTPNLPTIMFPHVPVASARNAMHNFPPPSDLLSGLEHDPMRPEQQPQHTTSFALDDSLNFGFSLSSSGIGVGHAPNMGMRGGVGLGASNIDSVGRGLLMVDRGRERGLGIDAGGEFGERSLLNSAI